MSDVTTYNAPKPVTCETATSDGLVEFTFDGDVQPASDVEARVLADLSAAGVVQIGAAKKSKSTATAQE